MLRYLTALLLLFSGLSLQGVQATNSPSQYRFPAPDKLYAIGDIHGDYQSAISVLQQTGLVDPAGNWQGKDAVLVSVGDLLDRGADSRKVIELFMRLQQQASEAGGQVVVLLGNHEQMNLTEELKYVTAADFANYVTEEQVSEIKRQRQAALDSFIRTHGGEQTAQLTKQFNQQYPPGYFGQRALFAPQGKFGQWLYQRPVMVVFGRIGFVHGGVSEQLANQSIEQLNLTTLQTIQSMVSAQQTLAQQGVDLSAMRFFARQNHLQQLLQQPQNETLKAAAQQWLQAADSPMLSSAGPLWHRGNVLCHPWYQGDLLDMLFTSWDIDHLVVGHTPTESRLIESYLDGRLIDIDTGLNQAYYKGNATLVALHHDHPQQWADNQWQALKPKRWDHYKGHSFKVWEQRLRDAEVIAATPIGEGVTKPLKVELQLGEETFSAAFKYEDIRPSRNRNKHHQLSDSYQFDLASYRVDQLLQLNMVPPTVARRVEGKNGALQLWIEGIFNERQRRDAERYPAETCVLQQQFALMNMFDILLHNDDRTMQNIMWQQGSWRLWFIDQSRAFRTYDRPPAYLQQAPLRSTPTLINSLNQLEFDSLSKETTEWLDSRQLRALLKRRDWLLRQLSQP